MSWPPRHKYNTCSQIQSNMIDFGFGLVNWQDMSYNNSWSWFLKPRAQAKEKKLLENFHAAGKMSHSTIGL